VVAVMIGIDPHKRSNTALVLDGRETVLARRRFANDSAGYRDLKAFTRGWKQRTWAVEGARGVGLSLAQRLAMEGEHVLDVPAVLSARVRALGGGSGRKTDEADAYAVAVAGLRGHGLQVVKPEDEVAVLKLLSDRRQQLVAQRIAAVNRLHDVLPDLLPGGASTRLTATKAHEILAALSRSDPVGQARKQLAVEHADDVAELDVKIKAMAKRIAAAVAQRPSALPDIKGIAAIGTALILGEVGDVRRFRSKHHFASYTGTAPIDEQRRPEQAPPQQRREPQAQLRPTHRRARPDPLSRARPELLRPQTRGGQEAPRGDALPQAAPVRRRVSRPSARPTEEARGGGPGRTLGGDSSIQRV